MRCNRGTLARERKSNGSRFAGRLNHSLALGGRMEPPDMGTQLRICDPLRKATDGLFEGPWIVEPGFIDGIEIKPGLTLGTKPMFEGVRTSHLKCVFETSINILDADEECVITLLCDMFRTS